MSVDYRKMLNFFPLAGSEISVLGKNDDIKPNHNVTLYVGANKAGIHGDRYDSYVLHVNEDTGKQHVASKFSHSDKTEALKQARDHRRKHAAELRDKGHKVKLG